MIRLLAMIGCASVLFACSSTKQPNAQLPLVDDSNQGIQAHITTSLHEILEQAAPDQVVVVANESLISSPIFYSARGNYCRFLTSSTKKELFCKAENGNWFAIPSVLSDLHTIEMGEGE